MLDSILLPQKEKTMSAIINKDVTKYLTTLAKRRIKKGEGVTADDAQRYLDRVGYVGSRSFIGGLLRKPKWRSRGFTHSKIPSNHGRTIRVWLPTRKLLDA